MVNILKQSYPELKIYVEEAPVQLSQDEEMHVCVVGSDILKKKFRYINPLKNEAKWIACQKFLASMYKGKFSTYSQLEKHITTSENPLEIVGIEKCEHKNQN